MTTPPLRGKRGRDRRIGERVAADFAARHAPPADDDAIDFDVAEVDAEVDDHLRAEDRDEAEREAAKERARLIEARRAATAAAAGAAIAKKGTGHRLPDLSGLPPLLVRTGSFESLLERVGPGGAEATKPERGRHAGLTSVPHGAKSYLAAALALAASGERLVWIARDAEIGDRVAEELGAWLGDPAAVVVLEPRTALAYERSELVADETAARVAALAAWRRGSARILVAGVQALLQHTIAPEDLPAAPREIAPGARLHQDALLHDLFDLGYSPVTEVAGRGEFARRGGIVDVFPPSMPLPIRIEFFGDEIDSLRAFDPTDQRTVRTVDRVVLLPASEFLLPAGGGAAIRDRLGRAAARLPERLATDLARFEGEAASAAQESARPASGGTRATPDPQTRAVAVGDAAEVWAAQLAPATGLDHVGPGTLLLLDEPGDLAEAAEFLWRQADERRCGAHRGRRPAEGLAVHLPVAPGLEGPPRRLTDPGVDMGIRAAGRRRDGIGPAQLGRPVRLAGARPAPGSCRSPSRCRDHLARRGRPDRPGQ